MSKVQVDDILPLAHVVSIPLTTAFRGLTTREALLIAGPEGPAEWSPFLEYDDAEAATWLRAALEQAFEPAPPHPPPSALTAPSRQFLPIKWQTCSLVQGCPPR
jgi:hypothetical protein